MNIAKRKSALDRALNKKLYKLGKAYGKALVKNCKTKSGMDSKQATKINSKKVAALDKALNARLYKLGHSYGMHLRKICGKKASQDMATKVAVDMLSLNPRAAKDADNDKWRYSKNIQGTGLTLGNAAVGALADKLIKNKKQSYLKDALVEGGSRALLGTPLAAIGAAAGVPAAWGIPAGLGAHGALNSLVRNKVQKSFPNLSTAQAQGVASGALGTLAGGALGGFVSRGNLGATALSALGGGIVGGLGGLASRWLANKLYAPMPKSELGKNDRGK